MSEESSKVYGVRYGLHMTRRLGSGRDGEVFITDHNTAVKLFLSRTGFSREYAVYRRLQDAGVTQIADHAVPELIHADETLMAIEMSVVPPPFVLDFAQAQIDVPWEAVWPEEVMAERWEHWEELFDARHWPKVLTIIHQLARRHGVYLLDVNPANIRFGDEGAP